MKYLTYCRKSSEDEGRQIMSIYSQRSELDRRLPSWGVHSVVDVLEEAKSARAPGRPVFDQMLKRIEAGEADGIIAWHPDRLARNSLDGGRIIYLLDQGVLKDLKFATYSFENTPQGKFMLGILFADSKYYVDNLSQNVRRGIRARVERGWLPGMAAIGYLNDKSNKTVVADPDRFNLMQRMLELMLTGAHSPRDLWRTAKDEWGLRTSIRGKIGGAPLSLSGVYRVLTNPFYAGVISWGGKTYPGKHPPMITLDQFNRIQELLGRPGRPRPKRHRFPFTGLIRCGECGHAVTAEHQVNRYGSHYTYYHCSRRHPTYQCHQPSVTAQGLEEQILGFLGGLTIPESHHRWALGRLERLAGERAKLAETERETLKRSHAAVDRERDNLTKLRLRDLLTDEEYEAHRQALDRERLRLQQHLDRPAADPFEPARSLLSFSYRAVDSFRTGNDQLKRLILATVGSNLVLRDKRVLIEAAKPFRSLPRRRVDSDLRAFVKDVRTLMLEGREKFEKVLEGIREVLGQPSALRDRPVRGRRAA